MQKTTKSFPVNLSHSPGTWKIVISLQKRRKAVTNRVESYRQEAMFSSKKKWFRYISSNYWNAIHNVWGDAPNSLLQIYKNYTKLRLLKAIFCTKQRISEPKCPQYAFEVVLPFILIVLWSLSFLESINKPFCRNLKLFLRNSCGFLIISGKTFHNYDTIR